jgi:hypothetical protein
MAVRSYDSPDREQSEPIRVVESVTEPIRSIFDLGTESVGSEHEVDSPASGDAPPSGGVSNSTFDPSSVTPNDSSDRDAPYGRTPTGRVRRRPVGSGAGNNGGNTRAGSGGRKNGTEVQAFLASILYGVHEIGANLMHAEELSLTDEEADLYGEGVLKVWQEYDMPIPDAKTMAWVNLAKVLSSIYGPRIMAIRMRKANERGNRPQPIRQVG